MEIKFGIPKERTKKEIVVLYPDTPVVIMHSKPEEKGSYKFELNKKAIDKFRFLLTGEEKVAFGFKDKSIFIANVTDNPVATGYKVTKKGTFSNKKLHNYITELISLDETKDHHFEILENVEVENAYELVLLRKEEDYTTQEVYNEIQNV